MPTPAARLLVRRDDFRTTRIEDSLADATRALAPGEARLAIGPFALTANNISYATSGEALGYWRFFPAPEGWGVVPVWGFAAVVESTAPDLPAGERVYGYFPPATHLIVHPTRTAPDSFTDGVSHRAELPPIYNRYLRVAADPSYRREREPVTCVLKPLFATAFLLDDFFADASFFAASQVLVASASSKTAYATAFCLSLRPRAQRPQIIGLTSSANAAFTRSLGCYDEVVTYDAISTLPADAPSIYVDMSGDAAVRRAVHERFGDRLRHDCAVGATHWRQAGRNEGLPGPRPEFFFAPNQAKKRSAAPPEGWGPGGLAQRMSAAWEAFLTAATDPAAPWLRVVEGRGADAIRDVWTRLFDGSVDAREGHVLSF